MRQHRKTTNSVRWALCALFIMGLTMGLGAVSHAATISYTTGYGPAQTNWNQNLSLQQFDPNLGVLLKVELVFTSQVSGSTKVENYLNSSAATYTTHNQGTVTVMDSSNNVLYAPGTTNFNHSANLAKYDGTLDFNGASGFTSVDNGAVNQGQIDLVSGDMDFSMFIGSGNVALPAVAMGQSNWSATSGNGAVVIKTLAQVNVQVVYLYQANGGVPLPQAAWGCIGLLGLLAVGRIRKALR